jgi:hypothetical protein
MLEGAIGENLYFDLSSTVLAGEDGAGDGEAGVGVSGGTRLLERQRNRRAPRRFRWPRHAGAKVGVPCELLGSAFGSLGQSALGEGLDPPSDTLEEERLVAGASGFAEDLKVLLTQLGGRHVAQGCEGLVDAGHGSFTPCPIGR